VILIFLINNFNMEGNSVAASSSSLKIAWFISLISSRIVEGGQGFIRARVFSPLFYFLQYITYRSMHGFLYSPVSQGCKAHSCRAMSPIRGPLASVMISSSASALSNLITKPSALAAVPLDLGMPRTPERAYLALARAMVI